MSVLIGNKSVSGVASLVASYFAFYYYIGRFRFVSIFALIILPDTQTISYTQTMLFFCSALACYKKYFFENVPISETDSGERISK